MLKLYSILFKRKKENQAIQATIASSHSLVDFHLSEAHCLFLLADYRTAIGHCQQVLALDPTNAKAYQLRGVIRYELQDFSGASDDLRISLNKGRKEGESAVVV
jgi:Flp pilus assembly protein TadD